MFAGGFGRAGIGACGAALEPTGREFTTPLVTAVPFKAGLMRGERLFYDAAMLCEQAGLDAHELQAAASPAGVT
jgi:hypothetical protein